MTRVNWAGCVDIYCLLHISNNSTSIFFGRATFSPLIHLVEIIWVISWIWSIRGPWWSTTLSQPGGHNLRTLLGTFGEQLAVSRESLPEHLANPEGERTERSRMSPDDMKRNPKQVLCLFYFQFHEPTNFFLCFSQFHMSFLSFISKRVLIDTASLINYSHSKPIWSCCSPLEWVAILRDD